MTCGTVDEVRVGPPQGLSQATGGAGKGSPCSSLMCMVVGMRSVQVRHSSLFQFAVANALRNKGLLDRRVSGSESLGVQKTILTVQPLQRLESDFCLLPFTTMP